MLKSSVVTDKTIPNRVRTKQRKGLSQQGLPIFRCLLFSKQSQIAEKQISVWDLVMGTNNLPSKKN